MKFALGYQLSESDEPPFAALVADYREHVAEVYFPWVGMASGRADLTRRRGWTDWAGQGRLEDDLRALRAMGVALDLLVIRLGRCAGCLFVHSSTLKASTGFMRAATIAG